MECRISFFITLFVASINMFVAFADGFDGHSVIPFLAAVFLICMEVKSQIVYRKIVKLQRQIENNTVPTEALQRLVIDPQVVGRLPWNNFVMLIQQYREQYRLNPEDNVNWKRDGF